MTWDREHGKTTTFCGTDEYICPEIIMHKPYGESVDWWALAILIYEMLSGGPPWRHRNRKKLYEMILTEEVKFINPNFSDNAKDLLQKMLKKKAEDRISPAEIKLHPFFNGINFDMLLQLQIIPPFKPTIVMIFLVLTKYYRHQSLMFLILTKFLHKKIHIKKLLRTVTKKN